jgi:ferritin-like metal-binding protein YciE
MNAAQQKVVQYLREAYADEQALTRVLQSQIAMTPQGSYRSGLQTHLDETRDHADRVARRLDALGHGSNPLAAVVGLGESVVGQAVAIVKAPWDLLRGSGGDEKVLKNAKDACATEALEIATYTAIERVARAVGDDETAALAASILADEERMLALIVREVPELTDAVVGDMPAATKRPVRRDRTTAGAIALGDDLAIARYDDLTAGEINAQLPELSAVDLVKIDAYERTNQKRTRVLSRIAALRDNAPSPATAG